MESSWSEWKMKYLKTARDVTYLMLSEETQEIASSGAFAILGIVLEYATRVKNKKRYKQFIFNGPIIRPIIDCALKTKKYGGPFLPQNKKHKGNCNFLFHNSDCFS